MDLMYLLIYLIRDLWGLFIRANRDNCDNGVNMTPQYFPNDVINSHYHPMILCRALK